jgi:hypothetical protein
MFGYGDSRRVFLQLARNLFSSEAVDLAPFRRDLFGNQLN